MTPTLRLFAATTTLILATSPVCAEVYNLEASFSETLNPNGAWTYGQTDGGTGFTTYGLTGSNGPLRSWNNGSSLVLHNTDAAAYGVGSAHFLPHTSYFHPGPDVTQDATIRFTAPSAGQYTLDAGFWGADSGYQGTNVAVYLNGVQLGATIAVSGYDPSAGTPFTFLQTFAMNSGDQLDIALDNAGVYSYDQTGVRALITSAAPVPEPGTLALLLVGLGVVARSMRRRCTG
jgi:hypothetical protein